MLRIRNLTLALHRKPRNARSKRALEKRAPKAVENPKTALILRGTSCSQIVRLALPADGIIAARD